MRLPEIAQRVYKGAQLVFHFDDVAGGGALVGSARCADHGHRSAMTLPARGRDHALELQARELLRSLGADKLAREVRVEWNTRLKTCAGRADYREKLISLNPLLRNHASSRQLDDLIAADKRECKMHSGSPNSSASPKNGEDLECNLHSRSRRFEGSTSNPQQGVIRDEIDRTLRHELAHLLAQWRAGRRRTAPHGIEWRQACRDLGIANEARCHNLPFAAKTYPPRYVYRCPNCKAEFPRVRRIRRAIACLACCRKHNSGDFDPRFRLKLTIIDV